MLNKPPSADLWVGQTDEAEMGLKYEEVDRLLYLLVDQRCTPEECVEAGFDRAYVEGVLQADSAQSLQAAHAANRQTEQPDGRLRFSLLSRLGHVIANAAA